MADNTQATNMRQPSSPPEFYTPPPPPGDPPITAPTTTQHMDQTTTQPLFEPSQQPPQPALAPPSATDPPSQLTADPFNDTHQNTAAPAQPDPFQEPPQHPNRPPPVGPLTETALHSEPAPILPPRPQAQPEPPAPPPPRASFDHIPDHPVMRQSSLGHLQSPDQSVQRVSMTPVQPQPLAPPPQAPVLDANAASLESDPAIASLHAMFPGFDLLVLQSVLEATGGDKDQAVDSLLSMSDPDYAPAQPPQQPAGGGAPNQDRQPTQEELDEQFARQLMLEEEQQAHGGAWPPRDQQPSSYPGTVPYQQYQPRHSGEHQRPPAAGGGMAGDLQQQFKNFIGGAGGSSGRRSAGAQGQGQGSSGAGYQDQLNKFADTGKKTLNSIFSKVKQKMEEFDGKNPSDTQNMNQPPQSGHWSNWQAPNPSQQQQQAPTYAQSPVPAQHVPTAQYLPPVQHGALNNNPYTMPQTNTDTNAALPASSERWQYQPEAAAPAQPPAPSAAAAAGAGTSAAEEPRRSVDTSRLGLLPKRPVSLMDTNANTRQAPAPAPAAGLERARDSDEESLEYVDRPMPGSMNRP